MKNLIVCTVCCTCGRPGMVKPGSDQMEIILTCCGFFPGVIYAIYRLLNRYPACMLCGGQELVGIDTPLGRTITKNIQKTL